MLPARRSTTTPAIEISGLRKTYQRGLRRSRHTALDGLDLLVEGGGRVHGFLGPNGSGKTTTVRVALGLVRADAGTVRLLGHDIPAGLPAAVGSVGSLVESPQFFRGFSGRRNLRMLGDAVGIPATRVEQMLEVVDLRERADDPVRGYSLGMRQRLAIAAAMLKDPRLLILDEPSNGLDPAGIRDTRALIRRLADEGTTVVLSSHLLAEVQQVCDEVTIVDRGRTRVSGPVGQVLAMSRGEGGARVRLTLEDDVEASQEVLQRAGFEVTASGSDLVVAGAPGPREVNRLLADRGLYVSALSVDAVDLEEAFIALTGGHGGFGGAQRDGLGPAGPEVQA